MKARAGRDCRADNQDAAGSRTQRSHLGHSVGAWHRRRPTACMKGTEAGSHQLVLYSWDAVLSRKEASAAWPPREFTSGRQCSAVRCGDRGEPRIVPGSASGATSGRACITSACSRPGDHATVCTPCGVGFTQRGVSVLWRSTPTNPTKEVGSNVGTPWPGGQGAVAPRPDEAGPASARGDSDDGASVDGVLSAVRSQVFSDQRSCLSRMATLPSDAEIMHDQRNLSPSGSGSATKL